MPLSLQHTDIQKIGFHILRIVPVGMILQSRKQEGRRAVVLFCQKRPDHLQFQAEGHAVHDIVQRAVVMQLPLRIITGAVCFHDNQLRVLMGENIFQHHFPEADGTGRHHIGITGKALK